MHSAATSPKRDRPITKGEAAEQRRLEGKSRRRACPRARHAEIGVAAADRDVVGLLQTSNHDRLENLIPVRYSRMLESPFAFYRGTAILQAADLARTRSSDIKVQACGDTHLLNFGGFATPERDLIFDINDFDETFPAPFEWDVKRLCASLVLAARWRGFSEAQARNAATAAAARYHEAMLTYANKPAMDVWYSHVNYASLLDRLQDEPELARIVDADIKKATRNTADTVYHKIISTKDGAVRIVDQPPLLFHTTNNFEQAGKIFLEQYTQTLREDYRALLARFRIVDAALKVVGVGSVGTRCFIVLMLDEHNCPLFLQIKEARASVLEVHHGPSAWPNHGERVVAGQRLMQAASDIFLGWARGPAGRDFYVRQLRDMKVSPRLEKFSASMLARYGRLCGEVLARAHAKAGQGLPIAGYLGSSDAFDVAIGKYAIGYADQVERDYEVFRAATRRGILPTETSGSLMETMIR